VSGGKNFDRVHDLDDAVHAYALPSALLHPRT
jgi:hypothetical protein